MISIYRAAGQTIPIAMAEPGITQSSGALGAVFQSWRCALFIRYVYTCVVYTQCMSISVVLVMPFILVLVKIYIAMHKEQ